MSLPAVSVNIVSLCAEFRNRQLSSEERRFPPKVSSGSNQAGHERPEICAAPKPQAPDINSNQNLESSYSGANQAHRRDRLPDRRC